MKTETISEFRGKYYFLSNFYDAPILFDGVMYENNEAAFQAQKCLKQTDQIQFALLSGKDAKKLGRKVKLRPDWERVKVDIMKAVVRTKFTQHKNLANLLIATDDSKLIEGNTWGDRFWGVCDGVGKNVLGTILMEVRKELKEKAPNPDGEKPDEEGLGENTYYPIIDCRDKSSIYPSVMKTVPIFTEKL